MGVVRKKGKKMERWWVERARERVGGALRQQCCYKITGYSILRAIPRTMILDYITAREPVLFLDTTPKMIKHVDLRRTRVKSVDLKPKTRCDF